MRFLMATFVSLIAKSLACSWTYNGSCYNFISEEKLSFFEAEYYCVVNHGGHLVAINSLEEDNFIRTQLLDWYDDSKFLQ